MNSVLSISPGQRDTDDTAPLLEHESNQDVIAHTHAHVQFMACTVGYTVCFDSDHDLTG